MTSLKSTSQATHRRSPGSSQSSMNGPPRHQLPSQQGHSLREKSSQYLTQAIRSGESSTLMQESKERTPRVLKYFTPKRQSNKIIGWNSRGRTRGKANQWLQRCRFKASPDLEAKLISGF
jgi:hypothetical protein